MAIRVIFNDVFSQMNFTFADAQKALEFVETALNTSSEDFSVIIKVEKGEEQHESV